MSSSGQQDQLYLRNWNVTVANAGGALDLSEFHIQFSVTQSDVQTPNNCNIRVFNLSDDTAQRFVGNEFDRFIIKAGYQTGPYGTVFDGAIKQSRKGRESNIDSYVDILGADTDDLYNYSIVNQTLAAGATTKQQIEAVAQGMGADIGRLPQSLDVGNPTQSIRGKVLYGMGKDYMRQLAIANQSRWSFQNGKLVMLANSEYVDAPPIVLNSNTGMIGVPQQTQSGIEIMSLLNPKLVIGQAVKINNKDIQQAQFDVAYGALNIFPGVTADGMYRIVVAEYYGDTRGNDWYTKMTCFAINADTDPSKAVNPWP